MGYENRIKFRVIGASAAYPAAAIVRADEDPGRPESVSDPRAALSPGTNPREANAMRIRTASHTTASSLISPPRTPPLPGELSNPVFAPRDPSVP